MTLPCEGGGTSTHLQFCTRASNSCVIALNYLTLLRAALIKEDSSKNLVEGRILGLKMRLLDLVCIDEYK